MIYKRPILYKILVELYPGVSVCCGTSYDSIYLPNTTEVLIPEETLDEIYTTKILPYNLTILRSQRNTLLTASDIYMISDYPHITESIKQEWIVYRQSLRDLPQQYPEPETDENDNLINVVFPDKPV
jgi:hypothetical protein